MNKLIDLKQQFMYLNTNKTIETVIEQFGGNSYDDGLFVIYRKEDAVYFTKLVEEAFPKADGKVYCFGRDWLNRQFAIFNNNLSIVMFDLCFDSVITISDDISNFFTYTIIDKKDIVFAEDFFLDWKKYSKKELSYYKCVNYKILPILGGDDDIYNLEISDPKFAYEFNLELIKNIKKLNL